MLISRAIALRTKYSTWACSPSSLATFTTSSHCDIAHSYRNWKEEYSIENYGCNAVISSTKIAVVETDVDLNENLKRTSVELLHSRVFQKLTCSGRAVIAVSLYTEPRKKPHYCRKAVLPRIQWVEDVSRGYSDLTEHLKPIYTFYIYRITCCTLTLYTLLF
jgi:hypothetical protein